MKKIIFVRHSKSSWDNMYIQDHDRELNKRGRRDSVFMAKKLKELGYTPEIIIASSAVRALTTAKNISEVLGVSDLRIENHLYSCSRKTIIDYVNALEAEASTILIVNHNPTITDIFNSYTSEYLYNVPTTGIFEVEFDIDNWKDVKSDNGKIVNYIYPKMYKDEL